PGAHLDPMRQFAWCNPRQVEDHDPPLRHPLAHLDPRREIEQQLPPVWSRGRAREVFVQMAERRVQIGCERPREAEPVAAAFLPARDLDRRRPFEHQAAEAVMQPGAYRDRLFAARRGREAERQEREQGGQPAAAAEPRSWQALYGAGQERWETARHPDPMRLARQAPITRVMRSLRVSAVNGLTIQPSAPAASAFAMRSLRFSAVIMMKGSGARSGSDRKSTRLNSSHVKI